MNDVPLRPHVSRPGSYVGLIRRLAPEEHPAHVEAWMRSEHGTLDAIDPFAFARAIKTAAERVRAAGRDENDELARSYGLPLD
jgi:hypothetical protein